MSLVSQSSESEVKNDEVKDDEASQGRESAVGLLRRAVEDHKNKIKRLELLLSLADGLAVGSPMEETLWTLLAGNTRFLR